MDDESNDSKNEEQVDHGAHNVKQHKGADPRNDQENAERQKCESHVQEPPANLLRLALRVRVFIGVTLLETETYPYQAKDLRPDMLCGSKSCIPGWQGVFGRPRVVLT